MEDRYLDKDMKIEALKESIISVTDEKLSWEEIKRRVAQGDIVYIIALNIAKRKIDEIENTKNTPKATRYSSIFEATRLISYALITIYMGLSFFQKPSWCRGDPVYNPDTNTYTEDCRGTALEGPDVIPLSNLPYLESWQLIILELVCVTLLTLRRYVKQVIKKKTSFTLFYSVCGVTVLIYLSEILQYGIGVKFPINQFLRPVYFILYSKAVRSNLRLYCRIFWRSREIFIAIAGIFFFFVCLAKVLFYQTSQNAPGVMNFDTFPNTLYNMFVALTTANYPDLMMPIFQEHRVSSLFFIIFMILLYVILLNIILAYFYFNYKEELIKEIRSFQKSNTKMIGTLFDINNTNGAANANGVDSPAASMEGTALLNKHDTTKIFEEIGKIHHQEVKKIFSDSRWKKVLMETLEAKSIRALFALGSLLVFILLVIQSCVVSPQPQSSYTPDQIAHNRKFNEFWLIIELCLNGFLLIDPLVRAITIGWKYFIEVWFYVYELSLSIIILILIVTKLWIDTDFSMTVVRVILIFRVLRFFRWVVSFEKYHLIYDTFVKLVPLFLDLLGVLTIAFYVFSTLGTVLFGGYIKTNLDINFSQYGDPPYYVYVNFNDFAQGLYTCVHLLIVNNWLYTVDVHCRTLGHFGYRIFFVSFYIIVVIICLNIMIAFILDVYVTQISIKQRKMGLSSHIDQPTYENFDEQGRTPTYAGNLQNNNNTNTWNFEEQANEDSPFIKPKSKYTELSPTFRKAGDNND